MYFLGLGIVLMALKYLEWGPVAAWDWWVVLAPWCLAMLWWYLADASCYTKRKSMERENLRKQQRIDANKNAIGTNNSRKKR